MFCIKCNDVSNCAQCLIAEYSYSYAELFKLCHYSECFYAECHMMSVISMSVKLSVIILSFLISNVIIMCLYFKYHRERES